MKKFDFHQHLVFHGDKLSVPVALLRKVCKDQGIKQTLLVPYDMGEKSWEGMVGHASIGRKSFEFKTNFLHNLVTTNLLAYDMIKDDPMFLLATWETVIPEATSATTLLPREKVKAVKFAPHFDHAEGGDEESYFKDMVERLSGMPQKIVEVHSGWGVGIEPFEILLESFPDKYIVILHMKEDDDRWRFQRERLLSKYDENLFCEISFCQTPKRLKQWYKLGFGKKLLFGTDFRTMEDVPFMKIMTNMVEYAGIPDEAKEDIFYNNAKELLARH